MICSLGQARGQTDTACRPNDGRCCIAWCSQAGSLVIVECRAEGINQMVYKSDSRGAQHLLQRQHSERAGRQAASIILSRSLALSTLSVLISAALHCIALHCTALHCTAYTLGARAQAAQVRSFIRSFASRRSMFPSRRGSTAAAAEHQYCMFAVVQTTVAGSRRAYLRPGLREDAGGTGIAPAPLLAPAPAPAPAPALAVGLDSSAPEAAVLGAAPGFWPT